MYRKVLRKKVKLKKVVKTQGCMSHLTKAFLCLGFKEQINCGKINRKYIDEGN